MSRFKSIRLNKHARTGNFLSAIDDLKAKERDTFSRGVSAPRLSDISTDLGDIYDGRLILSANESGEPTDAGFSGVFLAAYAQALADGNFWLANVLLGAVQYGIGEGGEFIRGTTFLSNHLATVGAYDRRARRGFQEVSSKPAYLIELMDDAVATNLITTNPGAESGSLTGWTGSANFSASTTPTPPTGTYCFKAVRTSTGTETLQGTKYAVTAGNSYRFGGKELQIDVKGMVATTTITISARWYNAVPTLLQTDIVYSGQPDSSFIQKSVIFAAPTGATQVEIYVSVAITITSGSGEVGAAFDDFSIELVSEYTAIRLDGTGVWGLTAAMSKNFFSDNFPLYCVPDGSIPAGTTTYLGPWYATNFIVGLEVTYGFYARAAGTLSQLCFRTSGTQPGTGSIILKARINGADTSIIATCAAGSAAGLFEDTTNSASFSKGDYITWIISNNASSTSAKITTINMKCTYTG